MPMEELGVPCPLTVQLLPIALQRTGVSMPVSTQPMSNTCNWLQGLGIPLTANNAAGEY